MRIFFGKQGGSICVFLTLILVPVLLFSGIIAVSYTHLGKLYTDSMLKYHVNIMIYENDIRDDNGNYFEDC